VYREAEGIPQHLARFAGSLSTPLAPGFPPTTGLLGTTALKGFARTRQAYPAFRKAIDKPGKVLKSIINFPKKAVKELYPSVAEGIASIPEETVKRVVEKGFIADEPTKETFHAVGKTAQEGIKYLGRVSGKKVAKESALLSKLAKGETEKPPASYIRAFDKKGNEVSRPIDDYIRGLTKKVDDIKRSEKIKTPVAKLLESKEGAKELVSDDARKLFKSPEGDALLRTPRGAKLLKSSVSAGLLKKDEADHFLKLAKIAELGKAPHRPLGRTLMKTGKGATSLKAKDKDFLKRIVTTLRMNPKFFNLQDLKREVQEYAIYTPQMAALKAPRPNYLFTGIAADLQRTVAHKYPKLDKANRISHKLQTLHKELEPELKNKAIGRKLEGFAGQNQQTKDLFFELDRMLPPELKFLEKTQRLLDKKEFQKWAPGRGGGSGSAEGVKNIGRAGALFSVPRFLKPAVAASVSPRVHGKLIDRFHKKKAAKIARTLQKEAKRQEKTPINFLKGLGKESLRRAGQSYLPRKAINIAAPPENPDGTFTNAYKRNLIRQDPRRTL